MAMNRDNAHEALSKLDRERAQEPLGARARLQLRRWAHLGRQVAGGSYPLVKTIPFRRVRNGSLRPLAGSASRRL